MLKAEANAATSEAQTLFQDLSAYLKPDDLKSSIAMSSPRPRTGPVPQVGRTYISHPLGSPTSSPSGTLDAQR